ncbi:MAG: hypothetical protein U0793_26180 [Gemmataceae bacterium]
MTEFQRLFLVQARDDFAILALLRKQTRIHPCHLLHYLQMATELLGKAHAWKDGPRTHTHRAFVPFLRSLGTNRKAQARLGREGHNESWRQLIKSSLSLAERVEALAPAIARDAPNPEYPWPRDAPVAAPVEHTFDVWQELEATPGGRRFFQLLNGLFGAAEAFL